MTMQNFQKIGFVGEHLISKLFGGKLSLDKYDPDKDLVLPDGKHAEVKTQVRNVIQNAFTVSLDTWTGNQIRKCVEVEKLFFVEYGTYGNIRVYDCSDRNYRTIKNQFGRMAAFDVDKMELIADFKSKYCDKMMELSTVNRKWLQDQYLYE